MVRRERERQISEREFGMLFDMVNRYAASSERVSHPKSISFGELPGGGGGGGGGGMRNWMLKWYYFRMGKKTTEVRGDFN